MNVFFLFGKIGVIVVFFALLMSCDFAHANGAAKDEVKKKPSSPPRPLDILAVTAPEYAAPKVGSKECLGRLVFDLAGELDWATYYDGRGSEGAGLAFSEHVRPLGEGVMFGNTRIEVFGPLNEKQLDSIQEHSPPGKVRFLSSLIKMANKEIDLLKKKKKMDFGEEEKKRVVNLESDIEMWRQRIHELESENSEFNSGLPDSEGYASDITFGNDDSYIHSVYWVFLKKGNYAFIFESTEELTAQMDKAKHAQQFITMLKNFRTRKSNEIPTELGICIPHGFIADDGKTTSEVHGALRYRDAPGVLFAIHTGTVGDRGTKATWFTALATASAPNVVSIDGQRIEAAVTRRIGPHSHAMGGLKGTQGGFAFKVSPPGKEAYEVYNVFTGCSGWLGTDALPYILTEMTTRTMEQASELTQNPPPFQQSMERLELLLKSIRLRPTNPLMPDLAKLPLKVRERVPRPR